MCLTTRDATIKIAEQDIQVFKNLCYPRVSFLKGLFKPKSKCPTSMFNGYLYEEGVTQPKVTLQPRSLFRDKSEYSVDEGYHSYLTPIQDCNAKFVIPKGTRYIEGQYGFGNKSVPNYVSETIVYVGKIGN
jgi:hypothetical protein